MEKQTPHNDELSFSVSSLTHKEDVSDLTHDPFENAYKEDLERYLVSRDRNYDTEQVFQEFWKNQRDHL